MCFLPAITWNCYFFRLGNKRKKFYALKTNKLWCAPVNAVLDHFTFCCFSFRALHLQPIIAHHTQADIGLRWTRVTVKLGYEICGVTHFYYLTSFVTSIALQAKYKTDYRYIFWGDNFREHHSSSSTPSHKCSYRLIIVLIIVTALGGPMSASCITILCKNTFLNTSLHC